MTDVEIIENPELEANCEEVSDTTEFIRGLIPPSSEPIARMEHYAQEYHVPIIQPEVAQWLRVFLKTRTFEHVLEIGTAIGYSAAIFAEGIHADGHIDTIEIDAEKVTIACANLDELGYAQTVTVHCGDAADVLETLQGPYDLVFLDAAKGQYLRYLKKIEPMLCDGAVVISDNVLFRGMLASKEKFKKRKRTIVKRLREYLNYLMTAESYESALLPIGDGMAFSVYSKGNTNHEEN